MTIKTMRIIVINFTIPGIPKALKRHRSTRSGHMYDPSSKDKQGMWLQIAKYKPKLPLAGDIYIKLIFYMPRPKSHFRTGKRSHVLKAKAPVFHSVRPDLDNLVKMLLDTISGKNKMVLDDSQIFMLEAKKVYTRAGTYYNCEPRTEVIIEEL